ncbi:MAG: hypothetical protein KGJ33_02060 [Patescibacteria group bacterium]|nr:hypothetical protein [Patescibacteria group bacterium]
MTPEEHSLLMRTHELAQENNAILRKMRRASLWTTIFRVIYWLILAGVGVGTYYVLQPYLMSAAKVLQQGESVINSLNTQSR